MFQVEFSLPVHITIDCITFTFNLPVVSAISVSVVSEGTDFLPAAYWWGEDSMGVEVPACVHVLQSDQVSALYFLASAA